MRLEHVNHAIRALEKVALGAIVAPCLTGILPSAAQSEMSAPNYRMGPVTLRDCKGKDPADPVNVAFSGPLASWQNSQRLVGFDFDGPELKWRTNLGNVPGGPQSIMNGAACTRLDGQSSRGSGVTGGDLRKTKRHTRFFEQTTAFAINKEDLTDALLLTVQDAHRDVKSIHCKGVGSAGPVNDRVPVKINGRTDGGYNDAQRLFMRAFPNRRGAVGRGPAEMRFVQCAREGPKYKYSVPWNGVVQFFGLSNQVACQGTWDRFLPITGKCPTGGREGEFRP